MNNQSGAKKESFESRLIKYLASQPFIDNSYDTLAEKLSEATGKPVMAKKVVFLAKNESFAKKWLLTGLFEMALKNQWMPVELDDWRNIVWTLTGKRQSVLGGDNSQIYTQLADIAEKPEQIFADNFKQVRDGHE